MADYTLPMVTPSDSTRTADSNQVHPRSPDDVVAVAGGTPVRSRDAFLVFGEPLLGEAEIEAVSDCLRSRWIGTGPRVTQFEQEVARYRNAPHAVAVSSCSAALHLSLLALGVGPGDEVITTAMTFCATVNAVIHTGATPVLVDCQRETFNIDPQAVADAVTSRTKAIIAVHMCGRSCDMDAIMKIARTRGIRVVEDCAHALEATYRGTPVGLIGDAGCFSFYSTKNITTAEGGMVLTKDKSIADAIRLSSNQGVEQNTWERFNAEGCHHYKIADVGFKYNMTDVAAAIGLVQLKQIDQFLARRREAWQWYLQELSDLAVELPHPLAPESEFAYHLFTILIDPERSGLHRDDMLVALREENIGTGVHFIPIHAHQYYRDRFGWKQGQFPNAEWIGSRTLSLPLTGGISKAAVEDVCWATRKILSHVGRQHASNGGK